MKVTNDVVHKFVHEVVEWLFSYALWQIANENIRRVFDIGSGKGTWHHIQR